ncbi:MAG: 4'-phosphopantetheinyl transferase superfamily protein [Oscillospiraceae bacterium]|nr:4'-phosphopantetheinyl transferase superfamily protein [Oscillospiraceae bacterium]
MVYLYALDVTTLVPDLAHYEGVIPQSRLEALAQRPGKEQLLGLGAELLFQRAVSRHLRGHPLPALREADENGKPRLTGAPDFHFNLSHSGYWAVCAVSDAPVGVDIQEVRSVNPNLSRKFSAAEQQELMTLPDHKRADRFFQLWVLKEAYAKCTGLGLLCPFRSFEGVAPGPGYSSTLVDFPVGHHYLAVCVQAEQAPDVNVIIMPA